MLVVVSGLEQQLFIPSLVVMNGFRDGKSGWEIAFGPTLSLSKKAKGYYDKDNNWHLKKNWNKTDSSGTPEPIPHNVVKRLDSRGSMHLVPGWIWAVGKTFQSGPLNIPVNAYAAPSREGWYIGVSVGFNTSKQ
jgi:hypothetical protein